MPEFRVSEISGTQGLGPGSRADARGRDDKYPARARRQRYFALMLERLTWSRFLPSMRTSLTAASRLGECTAPTS